MGSFKDKKHFPIFPTNVFEFELKDSKELNENLIKRIKKFENPNNLNNFSTTPVLFEYEDFQELQSLIKEIATQTLGFMNVEYDEVFMTRLMGHTVAKPEAMPPDTNANSLYSGVYCAKAGGARATFYDPRPQAWVLRPAFTNAHVFNSDAFFVDLREGTIVLFPSWLQFYVAFPPDKTEEDVYFTWSVMIRDAGAKKSLTP